ncbi:MAG: hypothetical protein HQK52_08020 [Oligoflexia bacterium]|nr:hypothetical protein [Oligoflexia bacterium]
MKNLLDILTNLEISTSEGTHSLLSTSSNILVPGALPVDFAQHTLRQGTLIRKIIPFDSIADWTHHLPENATDKWMDAYRGYYHRQVNHHFISDATTVFSKSKLSMVDFFKHIGLDVITVQGIPIIPNTTINLLSKFIGVNASKILPWAHLNIFDIAVGVVSVTNGGFDLFFALTGQLPWGMQTAIFTLGAGTLEIIGGVATENPLLLAAGALEVSSGVVSAWDYYTQPFLFGIPLSDLLDGLIGGAVAGTVVSSLAIAFKWNSTTTSQKVATIGKSVGISSLIGFLSAISCWASVPVGLAYTMGNIAYSLGDKSNQLCKDYPQTSPHAFSFAIKGLINRVGPQEAMRFMEALQNKEQEAIKVYEDFQNKKLEEAYDSLTKYGLASKIARVKKGE